MTQDSIFEALAHYASGMAAMSFCTWAVTLYKWRRRNRMISLLFLCVVYIAISFLKDIIFLFPPQLIADESLIENMVSIFDMGFVPLVCAFFLEASCPGIITTQRLIAAFLPFMGLLLFYGFSHASWVPIGTFILSTLAALFTLVAVPINAVRYNKYLSDNYSYTKNLSLGWCTSCVFGFFLLLAFYETCFYKPTWFAEMAYDVSFVAIWNIVCLKSRSHRVVADMIAYNTGANEIGSDDKATQHPLTDTVIKKTEDKELASTTDSATTHDGAWEAEPHQTSTDSEQARIIYITKSLQRCMETEKLYLNPQLSLSDLASAAGTNKTYISNHINRQGLTFYDFINKYRIEEACRIIDNMANGKRLPMADVASLSGFNSVSSFNRYFFKVKGVTPTAYLRRL